MRQIVPATIILCLYTTFAVAQGMPAQKGPSNSAVKSMDSNNSASPVEGANSFTMDQAKSHIEDKGYTKVTGLKKDSKGVWRGMAMKDGKSVPVTVDYQGNVN